MLAVLNGRDSLLEGFWAMRRAPLFKLLYERGFVAATGPTFSIASEEIVPASHNVLMLLRHHRVLQQISASPLAPIPNLYWRRANELTDWAEWLSDNPSVTVVSRDFSRTKDRASFQREFEGVLNIFRAVEHRLHLILLGVGAANAREAFVGLASVGATGTIVTAYPIMAAIKQGRRLVYSDSGAPKAVIEAGVDRLTLALTNMISFAGYVEILPH